MKFSKEPKNRHFPKGLVYGFCPNIEDFLIGVFHRSYFRKDRIFKLWKEKNDFNRKKNEILKRAKKWTFSKRVSLWILSKNRTFSCRRFSQKSYQKRSFLILWKEKNDFKWKKLRF